jgi:hypothetical protein
MSTTEDRLDKLWERPMRVERGDLVNLGLILDGVARDTRQPKRVRVDARYWAGALSDMLAYGSPSPERWVALLPTGFKLRDHYSIIVEQTIAELPDAVKAEIPAYLAMSRTIAAMVDNTDLCTDARLDALLALEDVMVRIQDASTEAEAVEAVEVET